MIRFHSSVDRLVGTSPGTATRFTRTGVEVRNFELYQDPMLRHHEIQNDSQWVDMCVFSRVEGKPGDKIP